MFELIGYRPALTGRVAALTRRGRMSPGDRANLSRRRSSFRRFPSGEAQYFAAGNHPASPACFLFVMRIGHFRRVELFIIVNPTFSFSPISLTDIKKKERLAKHA